MFSFRGNTIKDNYKLAFIILKAIDIDNIKQSNSDKSNPECDKTRFYNFPCFGKYPEQVQKSYQKSVNSSAKKLVLKVFLLLLKLITISQLKIKHLL